MTATTASAYAARQRGQFVTSTTTRQESIDDTAQLYAQYTAEFAPTLPSHVQLLQQLVSATLRLQRYDQIEATLLSHEPGTGDLAQQFKANLKQLEVLRRLRTAAERTIEHARKTLTDYRQRHPLRPGTPITLLIERPKPQPQPGPSTPQPDQLITHPSSLITHQSSIPPTCYPETNRTT